MAVRMMDHGQVKNSTARGLATDSLETCRWAGTAGGVTSLWAHESMLDLI